MITVPFDAEAACADGSCSKVSKIVVNPATQALTHIVVADESIRKARSRVASSDPRETP